MNHSCGFQHEQFGAKPRFNENGNLQVHGKDLSILVALQTPCMRPKFTAWVVFWGWLKRCENKSCFSSTFALGEFGRYSRYRTNFIPRSWMSGWKFGITCKINSVERGESYCTWSCSHPVHSKASFPKGIKQRPFYFTREIRTEKPLSSPAICSRTHIMHPGKGCQCLAQSSAANSSIFALVPAGSSLPVSGVDFHGADVQLQHVQQSYQNVNGRWSTFQRKNHSTLTPALWEYWHLKKRQ